MPWDETTPMDQRADFIADWLEQGNVSGLCRVYGISRKTAYKWLGRYRLEGPAGLVDQSRRPHHSPERTSPEIRSSLIGLRREHPSWGPKKLAALLSRQRPRWSIPAASTVGDILRGAGLVRSSSRRRRLGGSPVPGDRGAVPNAVWCVDYKGEFKLGNGEYCYPLTVSDEHSRYVLECRGFPSIRAEDVRERFERLFATYGLPQRIRSDNGAPFAGTGVARLSRLSVWWVRLGIALDRNQPHHPEQNGRHERMHRDLKAFATRPPERTWKAQQARFDRFCQMHNEERPHEALDMAFPSEHYVPSSRTLPSRLPEVTYPGHYEVRVVDHSGQVKFKGQTLFLSRALAGESVGLHERDHDLWDLQFATIPLGTYDLRQQRLQPTGGTSVRAERN
jgi:putative transposase